MLPWLVREGHCPGLSPRLALGYNGAVVGVYRIFLATSVTWPCGGDWSMMKGSIEGIEDDGGAMRATCEAAVVGMKH